MGDPALDTKNDPLAIEGMENLFVEDSPEDVPVSSGTVQDQTKYSPGLVQKGPADLIHPITVDEAARLLNISSNAICKRLRKGTLVGKKIAGKFKDEWLVEGAGLIEVLSLEFNSFEDGPSGNSEASGTVQDQANDYTGSVQESPGSVHEESRDSVIRLVNLVEKQAAKLEAAAGQIGYLQSQLESQRELVQAKEAEIRLLTDSQHKRSWWVRFSAWFLGRTTELP
jgi:hypothetical protein